MNSLTKYSKYKIFLLFLLYCNFTYAVKFTGGNGGLSIDGANASLDALQPIIKYFTYALSALQALVYSCLVIASCGMGFNLMFNPNERILHACTKLLAAATILICCIHGFPLWFGFNI